MQTYREEVKNGIFSYFKKNIAETLSGYRPTIWWGKSAGGLGKYKPSSIEYALPNEREILKGYRQVVSSKIRKAWSSGNKGTGNQSNNKVNGRDYKK